MSLLDRIEELREHLLHPHHEETRVERRYEREHKEQDQHHIDLSTGSEFLDVM